MSMKITGSWIGVGLLSAAICIPALALASNSMTLPGSNFEIDDDANLVRDHDAPSFDWEQAVGAGLTIVTDRPTGSGDNSFKGGTKEDTVDPNTTTGSIPNQKSDLKEFGSYQESNINGEFLALFWSRVQDPSGTTLMDFELNQGNQGLHDPTDNGDQFPVREGGDLLVEYKLAQGGVTPELFLYIWLESAADGECEANNTYPCWGNRTDLTGAAIGSVNTSLKTGSLNGSSYSYDPYTFGEALIDLYAAGIFTEGECDSFGYASLKSRSSDSFTAQMKDYIAPEAVNISNCADINITKTDDSNPPVGLAGAEFALYNDIGVVGTYEDGTDTLVTGITNPVFTDGTGVAGWSDIIAGDYCVVEETAPTGYELPDPNWECFTLEADTNKSVDFTNPRIPGVINIEKKDDEGTLLGDGWVFTLYTDVAGEPGVDAGFSCETTGGTCTIEDILPPDTYCVVETTNPAPTMYGDADPQCGIDVTLDGSVDLVFVNPRIPGEISIEKKDETGTLLGDGWVFTLYTDVAGEPGVDAGFSCETTGGTCTIEDILPAGTYCVVETTNPAPTMYGDADPQCGIDVALGSTQGLVFVNPRIPGEISIEKKDDTGTLLGNGWEFTLYTDVAGEPGVDAGFSCVTSGGTCTIEDILPAGTYCVVETINPAPTMYGDADPQCGLDVALGSTQGLVFVNPRIPGEISIEKKDDEGTLLGDGWEFTLYTDVAGEPGADAGFSCVTSGGTCTIEDILPAGTYCVVETVNPEPESYGDADPQCGLDVGLGSTQGLVFVNPRLLGAILITKTRKHAAGGPGPQVHEGVTFTIKGGELGAEGVNVITDSNGEACYDGLLVSSLAGDYSVTETVPEGYVADGDETKSVTVTLASDCGDGDEATVSFSNTPLTDVTVIVDSLIVGGTASTIVCTDSEGTVYDAATLNGDATLKVSNLLPTDPTVTLTCEITIDP